MGTMEELGETQAVDLNALDVLLDTLAAQALDPATRRVDFYTNITDRVNSISGSAAAAVWVLGKSGQVRLVQHAGLAGMSPADHVSLTQLAEGRLASPSNDKRETAELSKHSVFASTCQSVSGLKFAYVLVREKGDDELRQRIFGDLVNELSNQIESFENAFASRNKSRSAGNLAMIAQLLQNLGKSGGLTDLAYNLVNDLAKITQVDRVTFASPRGKILAVSGTSRVSLRTSVHRTLSQIAQASLSCRSTLEWNEGQLTGDVDRQQRNLPQRIAELPSKSGLAIPVGETGQRAGVLILENFAARDESDLEQRELIDETIALCSPVIQRAVRWHSIPGITTLDSLFNGLLVKPARSLLWIVSLSAVCLLVLYALFLIPRPFEIRCEGLLLPIQQRHVYAQLEGEVDQLLVTEGSSVEPGQTLLSIQSKDLEKELIAIEGEIGEARQELQNLTLASFSAANRDESPEDETRIASEIERTKIRLETLEARRTFFQQRKQKQQVYAPIAGTITTPELRQRLTSRPINRGDLLMTVADTQGQWNIELEIPENRIEFIDRAIEQTDQPLTVSFKLASDSKTSYTGTLDSVDHRSVDSSNEGPTVVVARVGIDEQELDEALRLGVRAYAKVNCGQRNNFFLLTYEAANKIKKWLYY